jgi:hypothetical protein
MKQCFNRALIKASHNFCVFSKLVWDTLIAPAPRTAQSPMNAWVRAREKVVFNIARILRALTGFVAVRSLNEVRIESSVKLLPFQDQPRKKLHERGVKIARLPLRHPGKQGGSAGPHNAIVFIAETPEGFGKLSVLLMAKCRMIVERHS